METQYASTTIADLVVKDYRNADVFKKFGIDFCCGGKKSLTKVCEEKGIDQVELEREIAAIESSTGLPSQNYNNWEIDFLAEHIIQTHHQYVKTSLPVIHQYLEKVAKVHGHYYAETIKIFEIFSQIADELSYHMLKEENVLFPYIKELVRTNGNSMMASPFGSVENPVKMMEHEHDMVGEWIKEIQKLSNNFTPPAEACNTYRVSYAKLNEFEQDLFLHIHLENNILFPKAIQMEKRFSAIRNN